MNSKNSRFEITPRELKKTLEVPGSKSFANRALILAALNPRDVTLVNVPDSTDVLNLLNVFKQVGLRVEKEKHKVVIRGSFPDCEKKLDQEVVVVHSGDGGTTTRFLIALLSLGEKKYQIEPEGGMRERPMKEMIEVLKSWGVKVEYKTTNSWMLIQGPLRASKKLSIDCSRSTQFASALALVLGEKEELLELEKLTSSGLYFQMTKEVLKKREATFFKVPVDFSSLSYPLALAAVGGECVITNCHEVDPYQADSALVSILELSGVQVEFSEDGLKLIGKDSLLPFSKDCSECPDLTPTLAFLASFCVGESILTGLSVLEHKESHRFDEIIKALQVFEIKHTFIKNEEIRIYGQKKGDYRPQKVDLKLVPDHRIVMMNYLFLRTLGGGSLDQIQHVQKSFPGFFEVME